jgi:hypothetical protein
LIYGALLPPIKSDKGINFVFYIFPLENFSFVNGTHMAWRAIQQVLQTLSKRQFNAQTSKESIHQFGPLSKDKS